MTDSLLIAAAMLVAGIGLIIGSFLNVVIARVPEGRSIVRPRSACGSCGHVISARDNIPVFSWVLLRGHCRHCHAVISARYPIVELATALFWLVLFGWAATNNSWAVLPVLLVVASAAIALFCIDLDCHRLPDAIVLPLLAVTIFGIAVPVLLGSIDWLGPVLGALVWVMVIGLLWLGTKGRGMGFGDVKLAPVLGAVAGLAGAGAAGVGLMASFVLGAIVGVGLRLAGRNARGQALAFGPFLIIGAFLGLLAGAGIWSAYLGALGLG